jgi:hypothetical protein
MPSAFNVFAILIGLCHRRTVRKSGPHHRGFSGSDGSVAADRIAAFVDRPHDPIAVAKPTARFARTDAPGQSTVGLRRSELHVGLRGTMNVISFVPANSSVFQIPAVCVPGRG